AALARALDGQTRGGEVLDADAERAEHGQLVVAGPTGGGAGQHLAHLSTDVILPGDRSLLDRQEELPRLVADRLAAVAAERGGRQRFDRQLAVGRHAGADGVDVGAGSEPAMLEHRVS